MNLAIQGRVEQYDAWPSRMADQRAVQQARANVAAAWTQVRRCTDAYKAAVRKGSKHNESP